MPPEYHVAVIPDGNRRWAREKGYNLSEGHVEGAETAKELVDWLEEFPEVERLTLWGLSRANHEKRGEKELEHLNRVYRDYAEDLREEGSRVHRNEIRVEAVGDLDLLYPEARREIEKLEVATSQYNSVELGLALGYDSAWDVEEAVEEAVEDGNPADYHRHLSMPEVDVVLGYGPDRAHLSGFIPQERMVDATVQFTGDYWPEAEKKHLEQALEKHRERSHTEGG